jgi:hypothetical protein
MYKILEKYIQLKVDQSTKTEEENANLIQLDENIQKNFLELYDKDVKHIHNNQEQIDKDLQFLFKETDKLTSTTKIAINLYDNFLEYLKEAGDLVNWCSLIEQEMIDIHEHIASRQRGNYHQDKSNENDL